MIKDWAAALAMLTAKKKKKEEEKKWKRKRKGETSRDQVEGARSRSKGVIKVGDVLMDVVDDVKKERNLCEICRVINLMIMLNVRVICKYINALI